MSKLILLHHSKYLVLIASYPVGLCVYFFVSETWINSNKTQTQSSKQYMITLSLCSLISVLC